MRRVDSENIYLRVIGTLRNHYGNANKNIDNSRYLYYFAIIPMRSTYSMWPTYPVTEQVARAFNLRQRIKNVPPCTHVLHKTLNSFYVIITFRSENEYEIEYEYDFQTY